MLTEAENIGRALARASAELPTGKASDQLRNYAGRAWEIINTPAFARVYGVVIADTSEAPELAKLVGETIFGPIRVQMEVIISRGISQGEFRTVIPSAAARAITGALVTQAFWCNQADFWGPAAGGLASRVVPETLGLMLDGLNRADSRSLSTDGRTK